MAEALIRGFANVPFVKSMSACDPNPDRRELLDSLGVNVSPNTSIVMGSDVVVLAVKPQYMTYALHSLAPLITPDQLVVSVAAGVSCRFIEDELMLDNGRPRLDTTPRVVRVMPNTPCLVQKGASAFAPGSAATEDDLVLVSELMRAVGTAVMVEERLLDAVTGLSGSGPAYMFMALEAMAEGGVAAGLPYGVALKLAAATMAGAAAMVSDGDDGSAADGLPPPHPAVLKSRVASPAGTTVAGLRVLESKGVRSAFIEAVVAASERSKELSRMNDGLSK
eukprot:jgi/Mesvir1/18279/Mv09544-RA.1